jgi:hypothetical protein
MMRPIPNPTGPGLVLECLMNDCGCFRVRGGDSVDSRAGADSNASSLPLSPGRPRCSSIATCKSREESAHFIRTY